jgi:Met-zincin/Domain of unknown function (DUF5117)/Domain of unknown function (DUF5118)
MAISSSKTLHSFALSAITLALTACATVTTPAPSVAVAAAKTVAAADDKAAVITPPGAANGARPGAAPAAPGAAPGTPPPPRPFAEIIKDAKEEAGFFTTWKKDDKVWIEIPEAMWERPFFFSVNVTHAIGDSGIFGNQMGGYLAAGRGQYYASFKKIGTQGVQLIARNTAHTATKDSPAARMIERAFSDSLIGNATIVSAPHPERKSVLIEANALLINDFPSAASRLEQAYRQPYAFDARNSSIDRAKNNDSETGFAVRAHYNLPKVVLPPPIPNPLAPPSRFPSTLPDVRSMFFGYYYGFSKLPEPMRPRLSDPRVGYFSTAVADYTDPDQRETRSRFIHRWRLEKKDPAAAMSEPKQPIVFWLDKNIPTAYRGAVTAGVLEWNKAFERAGFKNAIVVKQQGNNDDFDTSSTRHASVRWVAGNSVPFGARGPSKVDPRTGEILDADIEVNENITRVYNARASEDPPRPVATIGKGLFFNSGELCSYADSKLTETAFALDLLAARGDLEYGSEKAQIIVMDAIKDIMTHEVGHTIGMRHNFRASMSITPEQLRDSKFGAESGISSSVMDYNALNIATKDEKQGQYSMITVGEYDKWVVEYGYKETTPATEKAELGKVLARATEPALAYATDEDAGFGNIVEGIDPDVNRGDLGNDPLAFYEKRFTVVRELWDRWQTRQLPNGTQYETLRRNFERGFTLIGQVSELAAKYVGGVTVLRDPAGTGRQPITPVDAEKQRRALNLLTKNLFEVDSFNFKPEFIGKMSVDFDARFDNFDDDFGTGNIGSLDYSVASRVLGIQRAALSQLMRDSVAARVINAPEKMTDTGRAITLSEVYGNVQNAVWSEVTNAKSAVKIAPMRRNLQREHVRMISQSLANPSPRIPADARSLQREYAVELLAKLKTASTRSSAASMETRAHLNESIAVIEAALKAQVTKALG